MAVDAGPADAGAVVVAEVLNDGDNNDDNNSNNNNNNDNNDDNNINNCNNHHNNNDNNDDNDNDDNNDSNNDNDIITAYVCCVALLLSVVLFLRSFGPSGAFISTLAWGPASFLFCFFLRAWRASERQLVSARS